MGQKLLIKLKSQKPLKSSIESSTTSIDQTGEQKTGIKRLVVYHPLLKEQVQNALNHMKKGKAPGEDQLTSDILKLGGEELFKMVPST